MPDTQGTTSFVGSFLQGYMGHMDNAEHEKLQKVAGLMDIADRYRRMAEDPDASDEIYSHAQEQYQQKLSEADKVMNQKGSGLGAIMGIFGLGKKSKDGQPAPALPRTLFQKPTGESDAGSGPSNPAPMSRPPALGFLPPSDDQDLPAEFRGIPPSVYMAAGAQSGGTPPSAPAAAAKPDPYAGLSHAMKFHMRAQEIQGKMEQARQLDTARQQAVMQQGMNRDQYTWQQQQDIAARNAKVEAYKASDEYKLASPEEQRRALDYLQFGMPFKDPSMRLKTEVVPNEKGELVNRTTDLASNQVINETPYSVKSDEPLIQGIISADKAKGITTSRQDAQAKLGQIRLQGLNLGNQSKSSGIANQASLIQARQVRMDAVAKSKSGSLSTKDAIGLAKAAITYGKSIVMSRPGGVGMDDDAVSAADMPLARKWVEEVGISWDKLQSLISGNPQTTAADEAKKYRGPQQNAGGAGGSTGSILKPPK